MDFSNGQTSCELLNSYEVLQEQEKSHYRCPDYLRRCSKPSTHSEQRQQESGACRSRSSNILEKWRRKICKWKYNVADHFKFDREIVYISVSYMDRFLSQRTVDQRTLQLVATATLHLATKLYGTMIEIPSLIRLCRGQFEAKYIVLMEKLLLSDLSWRVHPPTPQCFFRILLEFPLLSGNRIDSSVKQDIIDRSNLLFEMAVCDYFFACMKPSSIAMASMLYVLDETTRRMARLKTSLSSARRDLLGSKHYPVDSREVERCLSRLKSLCLNRDQDDQERQRLCSREIRSSPASVVMETK